MTFPDHRFEAADTITDMKNRCVQLTNANQAYEKLVRENEALIKSLKDEVASIKLRCFRLTMVSAKPCLGSYLYLIYFKIYPIFKDNEKLNFTLRNKADSLKNLAETISSLTKENNSLQDRFNDLSNDNKNLLGSLQERIDQVAALKTELESVRIVRNFFDIFFATLYLVISANTKQLCKSFHRMFLLNFCVCVCGWLDHLTVVF